MQGLSPSAIFVDITAWGCLHHVAITTFQINVVPTV